MTSFVRACMMVALLLTGAPACVSLVAAPQQATVPSSKSVSVAQRSDWKGEIILTGEARQGGVMLGMAPQGVRRVTLDGVEVPVASDRHFLIAFDRDAPGTALLKAELEGGYVAQRTLAVQSGEWRIERVNASPTANIPGAEFLSRRKPELERIAAARAVNAVSDGWRQDFRWPLAGRISGWFGSQRIYRGNPGSYHSGVDVSAAGGTAFVAPADGVVVLAADKPFTLEGYLLIVDHGMGLNSAFLHCSSLLVRDGDTVRQGQVLGTVGSTGRATGPHLHWGMMWRGARIDPAILADRIE